MPLQLGLVGLPNVGKSTLFNALTQAGAAVAGYPFTTIEPNVGVVPVPDERLERIAAVIQPERAVPAALRVVDVAGLVRGAHRGEGLGNQFLGHIRDVDAVAMVVRCFEAADVPHVTTELDPLGDIETVELELALADMAVLDRHLERLRGRAKAAPRESAEAIAACERMSDALATGRALHRLELSATERQAVYEAALITIKPMLYVANVDESQLPHGGPLAEKVLARATEHGEEGLALCAALEAELAGWPTEEAAAYLSDLGLEARGLDRLIALGYRLLDYITFFTTTGGREVRAWALRRGSTALDAAGTVHSDMARGFIRAEAVHCDDLLAAGSIANARESGAWRLEGRDYVVQDGDVIHIRFSG